VSGNLLAPMLGLDSDANEYHVDRVLSCVNSHLTIVFSKHIYYYV
jgi:hypothetical protein